MEISALSALSKRNLLSQEKLVCHKQRHNILLPESPRFGRELSYRENSRIKSLERFEKEKSLEALLKALNDQSYQVRLLAYKTLKDLLHLSYSVEDGKKYQEALKLGEEAIKRYGNSKNFETAIRDLNREGYKFLFADDFIPPRVMTRDLLESHGFEECEVDDIKAQGLSLTVKDVFGKQGSGEFIVRRRSQFGYFILAVPKEKINPETFWHEYFHYLQHKVNLSNSLPLLSVCSYQREMEANQLIIDNHKVLHVFPKAVKKEIHLWSHNLKSILQLMSEEGSADPLKDLTS